MQPPPLEAHRHRRWIRSPAWTSLPLLLLLLASSLPASAAVTLIGPTAESLPDAIRIRWQTASELDHVGFLVQRGFDADGPFESIDASWQPARGVGQGGADYEWLDRDLRAGRDHYYRIEAIDQSNRSEFFGPVCARPGADACLGAAPEAPTQPGPGAPADPNPTPTLSRSATTPEPTREDDRARSTSPSRSRDADPAAPADPPTATARAATQAAASARPAMARATAPSELLRAATRAAGEAAAATLIASLPGPSQPASEPDVPQTDAIAESSDPSGGSNAPASSAASDPDPDLVALAPPPGPAADSDPAAQRQPGGLRLAWLLIPLLLLAAPTLIRRLLSARPDPDATESRPRGG